MRLNTYWLQDCVPALLHVRSDEPVPDRCLCRCVWREAPDHPELFLSTEAEVLCACGYSVRKSAAYKCISKLRNHNVDYRPPIGWYSKTPTTILKVCQESRHVATKFYTLSFPSLGVSYHFLVSPLRICNAELPGLCFSCLGFLGKYETNLYQSKAQTFFNFEADTLYLDIMTALSRRSSTRESTPWVDVLELLCSDERAKIQNLALDIDLFLHDPLDSSLKLRRDEAAQFLWGFVSIFDNLKKITMVVQNYPGSSSRQFSPRMSAWDLPTFVEPIDIDRRIYSEYYTTHENDITWPKVFPCIDVSCFAQARDAAIAEGEPAIPLPILEHKIMTILQIREDLEQFGNTT